MDKLKFYQETIKKIIADYASVSYPNREESELQSVFDDKNGHYFLMDIGWEDMSRIHTCLLHIDIKNGKIWIQKDFTEKGIAMDLIEAGIDKNEIVLGFQAPFKRPFTEFAAA